MLPAAAFLSVLSESDIEWLVANSEHHELGSGSVLIRRGEPVESLYLIVEGAFEVFIAMPDERHIATLYSGELVGEMSFVDLNPPSATVNAGTNSRVLAITKAALTAKIHDDADFGARFFKGISILLAGRLRAAYAPNPRLPPDANHKVEMDLLTKRFEEIRCRLASRNSS
jgi:CRP/FNR family cyclic AMP-dependent transcriptional regulator